MRYQVILEIDAKKCTINPAKWLQKFCIGFFLIAACFNATLLWAEAKTSTCIACHGKDGNSSNPLWPNLAGQHSSYLLKQLRDFKKGKTRSAPTMAAIVASLSDKDMVDLSNYYADLPRFAGKTPAKYKKRGELLYRGGDFEKELSACIACHGPKGDGNQPAGFPALTGQHAAYIIQQLQAFKDKKRYNDYNGIMQDISARMSQEDMTAVAYYIQGLY